MVEGNIPCSWNNCMTSCRRCSKIFLCPFSLASEAVFWEGVLGVLGERSQLSSAARTAFTQSEWREISFEYVMRVCLDLRLNWSMLKSGPKKRLPIMNEAADGVADDMALRSDCSSSAWAKKENKNITHNSVLQLFPTHQASAMAAASCGSSGWKLSVTMARKSRWATDNLRV